MGDLEHGATILVVDDAPENIQLLNHILRSKYRVLFATNGGEAIESAGKNRPDLIILDIVMPGMDGLQVCDQLQAQETTRDIPIIFITGKSDPKTETKGFTHGAVDFISKPINPPVVLARVKTHLELKRQRDDLATLSDERKRVANSLRERSVRLKERVAERTSELSLSEQALKEKTTLLDNILKTSINMSIIAVDLNFKIIYYNPTAEKMFGYKRDEVIGRTVQEIHILEEVEPSRFTNGIKNVHATGEHIYYVEQPEEEGGMVVESRVSATLDPEGRTTGYILMSRDITIARRAEQALQNAHDELEIRVEQRTKDLAESNALLQKEIQERKLLEEKLREQAEFDILTKLPNRKLFHDRLQQAVLAATRSEQPFALMFIDLDRFKWVNDTLGHDAGDQLLIEASQRLTGVVRKSDTVARLGGDEFVVILPDFVHVSMVDLVANKILEQMIRPFHLKEQDICISSSIGIAIFPHDGFTADELVKNADSAMYQAKEAGRNGFQFFSKATNQKVHKRLQMETAMRNALNNDEFFIDYQPKITLKTGEITGMEALVRWNHPADGVLTPNSFIPHAEETGLILKIDAWVLKTACRDAAKWRASGFPELKLAVNLSALQFRNEEQLMNLVEEAIDETGFPAHNLELEITESMMVHNMELATSVLNRLKKLGVTIFMDDFGTGYSSLAMLKSLPIQALKIDRSFVHKLEQDKKNTAFISAIISMAQQLGIHVIAEGVENPKQLQILKNHGGTEVQGFFFSPPLGSDAFLQLLQGIIPLGGRSDKIH